MPKTRNDTQAEPKLPMTDAQLKAWEASRDIDAELLGSVQQFKRGEGGWCFREWSLDGNRTSPEKHVCPI